jgi:hypothetical protein
MRSLIFALALAAPVSAVASTTTYTYSNPMTSMRHQSAQEVLLTFRNCSVQDRELVIGDKEYKMASVSTLRIYVPVGTPVFVYSQTNDHVHGQELMRVSANDEDKTVGLK